jgi:hypothetical protein
VTVVVDMPPALSEHERQHDGDDEDALGRVHDDPHPGAWESPLNARGVWDRDGGLASPQPDDRRGDDLRFGHGG